MKGCEYELAGLVLLSLALLVSLVLNVFFCIKHRASLCKERHKGCYPITYGGERLSQDEGHYTHPNPLPLEEIPIYGNISTEGRGSQEICVERITMQQTRDCVKTVEADLNYASLDLKLAKKPKKKNRHRQQGGHSLQNLLPIPDTEGHLPSADMVSYSRIYLNSQQIAQESEEMGKERDMNVERDGRRHEEEWRSAAWRDEQERERRNDFSNGSVCTQLTEVEEIGTNPFNCSFSHDSI